MENNHEFKKMAHIVISMKIKIEDFDFDNILVDEKSHENVLVFNIS